VRVGQLIRAYPVVTTREILRFLFIGRPSRNQSDAFVKKFFAVDQVAAAVGHESVPAKILRKRVATVNGNAGRAGKITGGPASAFDGAGKEARHTPARANDTPRFIRADAINLRRRAVGGDVRRGRRHGEERIATG